MEYLTVAQSIAHSGQPYHNDVTEIYGGDIENMLRLNKPYPQYKYVLGHHFPSYSYFLALPLLLIGNSFWAVCLTQILLLLGILSLTYYFTYYFTSNKIAASISAIGVSFSPTLSMYLTISMSEIFFVFLTMFTIFLALRPQKPKNHLILAIVLSTLAVTRLSFLLLCLPVFVYRFFKTERAKAYWTVPILLLPPLTAFTLGRNGFLYYYERISYTWDYLVHTTTANLGAISSYDFSLSRHAMYEFLLYAGIVILLISLVKFHKDPAYRIIAFAHLGILAAILLLYDWYAWRHIRFAMWFVPFAYVLFISLLTSIRTKTILTVCIVSALILLVPMVNLNRTLLLNTLPAEQAAMHQASTEAQRVKAYVDENYPEAEFILVPQWLRYVALVDPQRIYYTPWTSQSGVSIEQSLPRLHELQLFLDLAFMDDRDFERLTLANETAVSWDEVYMLEESPFDGITILVNRAIKY